MTEQKTEKIEFAPIGIADRERYEAILWRSGARGCEYSFANLFMWGEQAIRIEGEMVAILSRFGGRYLYPYPIGEGDRREMIARIIEDAHARGIAWRFSGLLPHEREELERFFPGQFDFVANEDSFDYVYNIEDLADLPGRKYHGKRNHCAQFESIYPDGEAVPITRENLDAAREMSRAWYAERERESDAADFEMEKIAITRAFDHYEELGFEGLMLVSRGEVLALTMGKAMSADTFDVNFEKAMPHAKGAYAAINRAFARYIRANHPEIRFLDREEDMGIEGLRRAKMSYYPHHRVEKFRATLK